VKEDILKDLNPEQHKAVTTLDGPILIVAGAGTGKTKVITHRIAHLIKSFPHLNPSNFLAVTFSKKASEEMLTRVEDLIGEHKDELWISTFHSFCHRILKDRSLDIGLPRNFRLLDRTGQSIFFKGIIPDLDLKYYLNLADPFSPINDFVRFISRCKDDLISPEEYLKYVNGIKDKEEKASKKEMAKIYVEYEKRMRETNCLDFGDLLIFTIKLFKSKPSILAEYEGQFHYILVDEFQDTNIAQIELLSMLSEKRKNICVVGDDDQAIYRFRGASYASFIKFKEKFPDLISLKLTQNYRSTKKILCASETLIKNNNPDRYDPQKNLWTTNSEGAVVDIVATNDYDSEAQVVVDAIKKICKKEKDYSRIAVLYRAHSHNEELLKRLKFEDIPYNIAGPAGLLERDEIKDIVAILAVLNDPRDSISLFRVLSIKRFGIDLDEIIELNKKARDEKKLLYDIIKDLEIKKIIKKETVTKLEEFNNLLKHLISLSNKVDIENLFYEIMEKTGYVKDLVIDLNRENELKLSNIGRFYRFINNYIQQNEKVMLFAFIAYLYAYIEAGGDMAESSEAPENENGVRLMTIHQAKGLEFSYVFIISLVQNRFPTRQRPDAIPFPVQLMKEELPKGNFHLQEERRLFYVALTRAKEKVFISTVNKPYHKESVFLNEILSEGSSNCVKKVYAEYDKEELGYKVKLGLSKKDLVILESKQRIMQAIDELEKRKSFDEGLADNIFERIKKEYYKLTGRLKSAKKDNTEEKLQLEKTFIPLPEELRLSYTQIDTFINCPLKYKFHYIYTIPTRPAASLRFGSDMHDTLEDFYIQIKGGRTPTLDDLYKIYLSHWNSLGYVNKTQEMQYQKSGFEILKKFYDTNKGHLLPPLYIEEEFLIKIGDCYFTGYIDRVDELSGGGVEIIDYKTGTPKTKAFVDKSMQLDLYAIACREILKLEPKVLSFYFLTNNEKVSTVCNPEELEDTKEFIASTAVQIRSQNFQPNPGRRCRWCDYRIICPAAQL